MVKLARSENLRLFSLNSNIPLATKIAENLGMQLSEASIKHFADGEIQISIYESVRGCEAYVIQSISDPVNSTLMELMIMVDALRRASARTINEIGRAHV